MSEVKDYEEHYVFFRLDGVNLDNFSDNIKTKNLVVYIKYNNNLYKSKISWYNDTNRYWYDIFFISYDNSHTCAQLLLYEFIDNNTDEKLIDVENIQMVVNSGLRHCVTKYFHYVIGDIYYDLHQENEKLRAQIKQKNDNIKSHNNNINSIINQIYKLKK